MFWLKATRCAALIQEREMKTKMLIEVESSGVPQEEVVRIVNKLINCGLSDAQASLEEGENLSIEAIRDAEIATDLNIRAPVLV